nr:T cell receptor beta [Andrias davidianus]
MQNILISPFLDHSGHCINGFHFTMAVSPHHAARHAIRFFLRLLLLADVYIAIRVTQMNNTLAVSSGGSAEIHCSHDDSSNLYILWYRQHKGAAITLMALSVWGSEPSYEDNFKSGYVVARPEILQSSFTIPSVKENDSATYFCAAGDRDGAGSVLYFGSGTKVSVIEDGITETTPNVVLFDPSPQEINEKGKATLVCLANRFYPDHVTLSWSVNGVERTAGVKTDDSPTSGDASLYFLSSRLRLSKKEWFRPQNTFRCTVHFHPKNVDISKETKGREDCGVTPDSYRKSANTAKFTYLLLIAKSAFYGLFVTLLVWKMKPGGEKNFT